MISLPKSPKLVEEKDNKASFIIEALYPGYGVTVGNALRRVLFSSLPGAAITQVKIKGVQHEFTTLSGILEDVITICLNLKKLRFNLHSDDAQQAILMVQGEGSARASDFKLPSQLELVNKELHIATLTDKKADLEIEILVEKGVGYEPHEMRGKEKLEIGQISLNAIYTPIRNVSYRVENMRVGERTDFDRLFITIETDGTTSPQEALIKASEILINHFSLIFQEKDVLLKEAVKKKTKKVKKGTEAKKIKKIAKKKAAPKTASKIARLKRVAAEKKPVKKITKHAKTKERKKIS